MKQFNMPLSVAGGSQIWDANENIIVTMPEDDAETRMQVEAFAHAVNCHGDLVAALQAARKFAISAIGAMVTGIGFDPLEHVVVKKIDAALARAGETS